MSIDATRRGFLGSAVGLAGLAAAAGAPAAGPAEEAPLGFRLGIASYSFREFQRGLAIKCIKELNVNTVSVKEFHIPISASPAEWAKGRRDFEKAGIRITSGGNVSFPSDDPDDIRHKFEYAKACGMPMMVCAPTHTNLDLLEKFIKEYNIKLAIHNHGPEDKQYPTPQSVLEAVKDRDPRFGLCMDVGHSARTGVDVVESVAQAGPRLLAMHIKDLRNTRERDSQCDVGEGVLPIVGIFKQLHKMGYTGEVDQEYEINGDNPLPGMKNSFSYMRGALAGLKG